MGIDGSEIKRRREAKERKESASKILKETSTRQEEQEEASETNKYKVVSKLIITVFAAVFLYAWFGPTITLNAIINGAVDNDIERLKANIDFPLLRESFKEQISDQVAKSLASDMQDNPFAALVVGMTGSITDQIIDSVVTPAGLLRLTRLEEDKKNEGANIFQLFSKTKCSFASTSKATITMRDQGDEPSKLIFLRNGVSWKLADIIIPDTDQIYSITDKEKTITETSWDIKTVSTSPVSVTSSQTSKRSYESTQYRENTENSIVNAYYQFTDVLSSVYIRMKNKETSSIQQIEELTEISSTLNSELSPNLSSSGKLSPNTSRKIEVLQGVTKAIGIQAEANKGLGKLRESAFLSSKAQFCGAFMMKVISEDFFYQNGTPYTKIDISDDVCFAD